VPSSSSVVLQATISVSCVPHITELHALELEAVEGIFLITFCDKALVLTKYFDVPILS